MKVKDIIKQLQYCDPESEIRNSNGSEPEIRVDDQGVVIGGSFSITFSPDFFKSEINFTPTTEDSYDGGKSNTKVEMDGITLNELLAKEESPEWRKQAEFRRDNERWLRMSANIAIKVNTCLREKKISRDDLAARIQSDTETVNKILKGRENLTLETIAKLEYALGIYIL